MPVIRAGWTCRHRVHDGEYWLRKVSMPSQAKKLALAESIIEGHHDKTMVFGKEGVSERFFLSISQVAGQSRCHT